MIKNCLNPEGHQNSCSGSKVTAILLKGWIWPIGGASAGLGLPCSLRSRLVFLLILNNKRIFFQKLNIITLFLLYLWAKYEPIWLNFTVKPVICSAN